MQQAKQETEVTADAYTDFDRLYIRLAFDLASRSKGIRAKVGAVLVTNNGVVLTGYNGTPPGWSNELETPVENEHSELTELSLVTKPSVIHAELNCILKAAKEGISVIGSTVYVTLAPCEQCAAMLASAGVKRVIYANDYRSMQGVKSLIAHGISVSKIQLFDKQKE